MAANPCFQYGGLPFTPKSTMQNQFKKVLPYRALEARAPLRDRLAIIDEFVKQYGFPVIIKPDTGHRGVGIRKSSSVDEIHRWLTEQKWDLLIQVYDQQKYEYGVFYVREPDHKLGSVISITKKEIPPHLDTVTASHCRGAIFTDEKQLLTPLLSQHINDLCTDKAFYFGRFDVKAKSDQALSVGDFSIIEVNGATSEFIHILDESTSSLKGLSEIYRQWSLLYKVALKSRRKHDVEPRFRQFISLYLRFFKQTYRAEGSLW